jgi:hypothetical protein
VAADLFWLGKQPLGSSFSLPTKPGVPAKREVTSSERAQISEARQNRKSELYCKFLDKQDHIQWGTCDNCGEKKLTSEGYAQRRDTGQKMCKRCVCYTCSTRWHEPGAECTRLRDFLLRLRYGNTSIGEQHYKQLEETEMEWLRERSSSVKQRKQSFWQDTKSTFTQELP